MYSVAPLPLPPQKKEKKKYTNNYKQNKIKQSVFPTVHYVPQINQNKIQYY